MAIAYWISKFSQEAILVEVFLIAVLSTVYIGYLLFQKRRYGVAKKTIPEEVVRAYLFEMLSHAQGFKNQLFGDEFKVAAGEGVKFDASAVAATAAASAPAVIIQGSSGGDTAAIAAQLAASTAKQQELTKTVATLTAEKSALEAKLAAAPSGAPATGDNKDLADKIAKLESKLAEYEVIEDDLANLKRYQQENKQLKAQLEALQKGGAAPAPEAAAPPAEAAVAAPEPAPAPAAEPAPAPEPAAAPAPEVAAAPATEPAPSPIEAAEQTAATNAQAENFEKLVDKVESSLASPPAGASAVDPTVVAEATTAAPTSDTAAPPSAEAPKSEKSDADLLSEFERMLSS